MIKPSSARRGLVFRDPSTSTARQFWRLADELPDGSWRAEHLTDKRNKPTRVFTARELEGLEPVPDHPIVDVNLNTLLGRRVRLETVFGKSSGFVTGVEVKTLEIGDDSFEMPVAIVVGGDRFELHQIERIEDR